MFCKKCGKQIPDDSIFCPKCGANCEIKLNSEPSKKVELNKTPERTTTSANTYNAPRPQTTNTPQPYNNQPSQPARPVQPTQPTQPTQPAQPTQPNNQQMNNNTQNVYLNIILFTRIGAIASIVICFIVGFIAEGMKPTLPQDYYYWTSTQLNEYNEKVNSYNSVVIISNIFFVVFCICDFIRLICAIILAAAKGEFAGVGIFIGVGVGITLLIGALVNNMMTAFIIFGLIAFAYLGHKIQEWY